MTSRCVLLVAGASAACGAIGVGDPAPGLTRSLESSRRFVCEAVEPATLRKRHPGLIEAPRPRGDYVERDALTCAEMVLGPTERPGATGAILMTLADEMSQLARALSAEVTAATRTWLVEAHVEDPQLGAKVRFAAQAALVASGLRVSDRLPILAGKDIIEIAERDPRAAHPEACRRYFTRDRLAPGDAVLALLVLDRRETTLHAGACTDGRWRWLR